MRESKLIPQDLKEAIQACITEDGVWAADRDRFDTKTLQSLRTYATRQGWFFSSAGNGVEITVEKQTVSAQMKRKMAGKETAFQVTGNASTVRNYIADYNKQNGTGWKVSKVSTAGVFVIFKLPAKPKRSV
jgi:hypothetical protein